MSKDYGIIERKKIIDEVELYIKEYYEPLLSPLMFKVAKNYEKFCECTYRRFMSKKIMCCLKDPKNYKKPLLEILDDLEVEYYDYMMIRSQVFEPVYENPFCIAYEMIIDVKDFVMDAIYGYREEEHRQPPLGYYLSQTSI